MSLTGGKLLCLDQSGNVYKEVLVKDGKLTIGHLMSCDHVITDKRSNNVHCEIVVDSLGKVISHYLKMFHLLLTFI